MGIKKISQAAGVLLAVSAATPALATNGYFLHGYGAASAAMGGVASRSSKKDDALKAQRFRPPARFRRPPRAGRNGMRPILRPAACAPNR